MQLQSFIPPYPINLQQFTQAACEATWALPSVLSLLQSHQDFFFAYLGMKGGLGRGVAKQDGEDFSFF